MKKFKCTVIKETTMEIEIDETVWTDKLIKDWSRTFGNVDDLSEVVEELAKRKINYCDGEFIEGFGIPMINGQTPYSCKNNQFQNPINICNQEEYVDVTVNEIK